MTIKTGNPETDKMFVQLARLVRESISVPNRLLPDRFRDKRAKLSGVSLQRIHEKLEAEANSISEHEKLKAEKAKRIANYRKQVELQVANGVDANDLQIAEYDADERLLNDKQINFCGAAVRARFMDADDFEVE